MIIRRVFFLCLFGLPITGSAHHAIGGNYDARTIIEVEGEVTDVLWRNPHAQVSMRVIDQNGDAQLWEMAMDSVSNMLRWQIAPDFIQVGDNIRVAGNPAIRIEHGLYIRNVLTRDEEEVLLGRATEPRWTDRTIEMSESRRLGIGDTSAPELGIFRVWGTPDTIPMLFPRDLGQTSSGRANLTEAALEAVDNFVFLRDSPLRDCALKGMPLIMESPYPLQFLRDGENIIYHVEEYDTVRTIHMAPDASSEGQPESLLGYSVGRWEDDRTLLVTTTQMGWGHFDGQGIPASTAAEMVERFAVSPLGDRLDYTMTFTDPENLIEPVTLGKHWVWYPDAEVAVYDCSLEAESY